MFVILHMPGDSFQKVQRGQRFRGLPSDAYNAFLEAQRTIKEAQAFFGQEFGQQIVDPTVIRVRSSAARERYQVLGLDSPLVSPTANLAEFQKHVAMSASPPAASDSPFGILYEPLAANGIGKLIVAGLSPVKINVIAAGDTFASPIPGDSTKLQSGTSGPARIVWKEGGTGVQWAIVLLGGGASSSSLQPVRITSDTQDEDGFYPGFILVYDEETDEFADGDVILVRDLNA